MSEDPGRPSVLMVCTRDIPAQSESGRERTMAFIRRSLEEQGDVRFMRLHSLLERRSGRRLLSVTVALMGGVLRGRPLPLQALLFHDPRAARELEAEVRRTHPDAVYFDGVRSGSLATSLRAHCPQLTIVCDFDDLMSRRMKVLAASRQPISMGYLRKLVPAWVQRHVLDGFVARGIQAYEWRALRSLERRIAAACDAVVLVSSVDASHAREQMPAASVAVIPPYMAAPRAAAPLGSVERFVFIGSDSLLQNRQAIDYLVGLWARVRPATPLHVYGKQSATRVETPGVKFRGFIEDVAQAYQPGSVLLAPSFLSGGVKTKVLEAMSFGVIPLGTEITFEGIDADCRALTATPEQLEDWVADPARWCATWREQGGTVIAKVAISHSERLLGQRWRETVWPPA